MPMEQTKDRFLGVPEFRGGLRSWRLGPHSDTVAASTATTATRTTLSGASTSSSPHEQTISQRTRYLHKVHHAQPCGGGLGWAFAATIRRTA